MSSRRHLSEFDVGSFVRDLRRQDPKFRWEPKPQRAKELLRHIRAQVPRPAGMDKKEYVTAIKAAINRYAGRAVPALAPSPPSLRRDLSDEGWALHARALASPGESKGDDGGVLEPAMPRKQLPRPGRPAVRRDQIECVRTLLDRDDPEGWGGCVTALTVWDGRVVSGSYDGWKARIKLWDAEGACVRTLEGHGSYVRALAVWEGRLASGSEDTTIRLWDNGGGGCVRTLEGHHGSVNALAVWDGFLASGSGDWTIKLWNAEGACLRMLEQHTGCVRALTVWEGRLVSGASDNMIKLWGDQALGPGGGGVRTLEGHRGAEGVCALTVWEGMLASGSEDMIKLWNAELACVQTLRRTPKMETGPKEDVPGHEGTVYALTVWGGRLASGASDNMIKLWDAEGAVIEGGELEGAVWEGTGVRTLGGHTHRHDVNALTVWDGRLVSASNDETIKLWDTVEKLSPRLHVGDAVEHNWKGRGRWYKGTVTKVRGHKSVDIRYEDGSVSRAEITQCR